MTDRTAPLLAVFLFAGCGSPAPPPAGPEVRVAAASDLKFAFDELAPAFAAHEPGLTATATFGSSGTLYSQIANGAPFDVFLSADAQFPRRLTASGSAEENASFPYAVGYLVVWVPNGSGLDVAALNIRATAEPAVQKVALANPKTAPYGRAAEEALRNIGLYDGVKHKLVFAESVSHAAQFAESGAADVGLVAKSLALSPTLRTRGRFEDVPVGAYTKLDQVGVILKAARDRPAAEKWRAFLTGAEGRQILARYGFTPPGD